MPSCAAQGERISLRMFGTSGSSRFDVGGTLLVTTAATRGVHALTCRRTMPGSTAGDELPVGLRIQQGHGRTGAPFPCSPLAAGRALRRLKAAAQVPLLSLLRIERRETRSDKWKDDKDIDSDERMQAPPAAHPCLRRACLRATVRAPGSSTSAAPLRGTTGRSPLRPARHGTLALYG